MFTLDGNVILSQIFMHFSEICSILHKTNKSLCAINHPDRYKNVTILSEIKKTILNKKKV